MPPVSSVKNRMHSFNVCDNVVFTLRIDKEGCFL